MNRRSRSRPSNDPRGRARSRSLRLRLTALAALAITVTVGLATAVLVATLVSSVRSNETTTLNAYAESVARSATDGRWPTPLPPAPGDPGIWAQVVDSSGRVVAATENVAGQPVMYTLAAGSTSPKPAPTLVGHGDEQVVAQRYVVGSTPVVVYAGGPTRLLSILTSDIRGHLLYAVPLVLLGAIGISWLLIGRTLRPVERMRAEAAEITGSGLHRRIPEPDGDDEIGRLARTLNIMLGRLENSAARQRRFVSDASHELRTPVTAIRTSMEVGLAHPDQAPWPELATRVVAESARLQRLVDDLLLHARADDDTLVSRHEPVDLRSLAVAAVDAVDAVPSRIPIAVEAEDGVRVTGDPDQLTRLLRNLLDNAERHAAAHIRVRVTTDGPDTAVVEVADDGPGIPLADRDRVFDRFVRLQTARERGPGTTAGTGLGLSIARDIVTAHGGTIEVTDADPERSHERGAKFTVRLPAGDR
ncbi:signal transduction histidine kinase [Catenulispora sp. GAS73]|uniref:sensor histidine kinase n=1 Tax=Catenulispora sp. GAS73 TaxID=3156269 RepID=UPI003517947D